MPRPPKDPKTRQRRNRDATAATLIDSSPLLDGKKPKLPALSTLGREGKWHKYVLEWWAEIWSSPMASEYTQPDVHGLVMLMDMQDRYWKGETDLGAEIRLQRQCYGLTNLDRRRLQWEIKRVEAGKSKVPERPKRQGDPRSVLKAVK